MLHSPDVHFVSIPRISSGLQDCLGRWSYHPKDDSASWGGDPPRLFFNVSHQIH